MSLAPQPPECVSGLDTSGQFHIGAGMTLAVDGPYIRILCGRSQQSVRVTGESLGNTLADKYFQASDIRA